jgi:ABC-type branched-subunit amino acid transport system substrate-binding protein
VAKLTGKPVDVMTILDEDPAIGVHFPDARAGVEAGVYAINHQVGGLGGTGRPVNDIICVTNADPNQEAACARDAAANPNVVAVIGSYGQSTPAYPILEQAGIPMISNEYNSALDGTSSISYPTDNSDPAPPAPAPVGQQFERDCVSSKTISIGIVDVTGATQSAAYVAALMKANGMSVGASTPVAAEDPDISVPVATLLHSGADSIDLLLDNTTTQRFIVEVSDQGYTGKVKLISNGGVDFGPSELAGLGAAADDIYINRQFAPVEYSNVPGAKALEAALAAVGQTKIGVDDILEMGYVGFELLSQALKNLSGAPITRANIIKSLNKISDFTAGGLTHPLNFTKPGPDPKLPRYVAPYIGFPTVITDGKVLPLHCAGS